MSRAALEYIGVGGLGYTFNALDESATNKYSDAIKLFRYVHIASTLTYIFQLLICFHYSQPDELQANPRTTDTSLCR